MEVVDNVIVLDTYCGNRTIYDVFWDPALSWNTSSPDISRCLYKTALSPGSCCFLWFISLFYIPYLRVLPTLHSWNSISRLTVFKLVCGSLLIAVSLVDLFYYITIRYSEPRVVYPVDYVEATARIITYVFATGLTYWVYRKGEHSSGVLVVFWFFQLVLGIVEFRSRILQAQRKEYSGYDLFTMVTGYVQFVLVVLVFLANNFVDLSAMQQDTKELESPEEEPLLVDKSPAEGTVIESPCPEATSTFFSRLFFIWYTRMIRIGYKRTLSDRDVWDIRQGDGTVELVPEFTKAWESELCKCDLRERKLYTEAEYENMQTQHVAMKQKSVDGYGSLNNHLSNGISHHRRAADTTETTDPSVLKALGKMMGFYYAFPGILLLGYDIMTMANPMVLSVLITYIESRDPFRWKGYVYAFLLFFVSMSSILCIHQHFHFLYTAGMRVRAALCGVIYRKSLRLSCTSRKHATVGEIVNLMQVDTQKIQDSAQFMHYLWSAPLLIAIATVLLYTQLGVAAFAGMLFMLAFLPLNSVIFARKIRNYQVLKLYAWEEFFERRLLSIREEELKYLRKAAVLGALTYIMWFSSTVIVALLCFMTYVLISPENILDANKAFVSLSLIQATVFPITILPTSIMYAVQSYVSVQRINKFLLLEEIDPNNVEYKTSSSEAITVSDGSFSWGEEDRITLRNLTVRIKKGSLVAVVGTVGSGKSSLVSAILGDMQKLGGHVTVSGSQAYVPQQAWIQNMTLKDNILFTDTYDSKRYQRVLRACALLPDLQILPGGDATEIGERGINLSGGQKQRVSLARAVYQDADIYLLDDPLSAVDAHVGKHIFEQLVGHSGMLAGKTRLLVTHSVSFLPHMDSIIVMKDGVITETGTYEQLRRKDGDFSEFLQTYMRDAEEEILDANEDGTQSEGSLTKMSSISSGRSVSNVRRRTRSKRTSMSKESELPNKQEKIKLIETETAEEGSVKMSVLTEYARAASIRHAVTVLVAMVFIVVTQVLTNIWLSEWTNDVVVNGTQDTALRDLRLGVYGGLGAAQSLSVLALAMSIALGSISATKLLHEKLLSNVLKCPMSFFDTTPLGRILNRFAKDTDICDTNIPQYLQSFVTTLAPIFSTFIIICYSLPIFIAVVIPLAIGFVILQRVYVRCARQLKRMDSIRRSPMYAFFSETLNGHSSIRAYKQEERFMTHNDQLIDNSTKVWFQTFTSNRWIGIWAEFLGDLVILSTALLSVSQKDTLNPGLVGLSLSFAMQMSLNLVFSLRSSCELETYIVAVERIQEYINAPTEAGWILPERRPPADWPVDGKVTFTEYSTRYRSGLDLVLKGVTCHIEQGEKVGVVGRTGAGKSSLTLALFRIIEPAGGCIQIDGIDTSSIGLHDVRNQLTIIPQDPVLFSGTIRFNLDPADVYTDADIWDALEHAHLKSFVCTLPDTLEYECGEDGENLSVGQRQLICLARALLKKAKILVLDEATAAVDMETDDLIQKTIREEFKHCTVLTIAHRINTIMDYDRVMVMGAGKILEFDAPGVLSAKTDSVFYGMAKDAGVL